MGVCYGVVLVNNLVCRLTVAILVLSTSQADFERLRLSRAGCTTSKPQFAKVASIGIAMAISCGTLL